MKTLPIETPVKSESCRQMIESRVTACIAPDRYLLTSGRIARPAISCVVRPAVGDLVLAAAGGEDCHILHILAREEDKAAVICVPDARELRIEQENLTFIARQKIAIQSLHELEFACAGTLSQSALNQFVHVAEALVESFDQHFSRSRICTQEASEILKMHGAQVLLSAESDLRADAERITMG